MPRLAILSLVVLFALPLCAQQDGATRASELVKQLGSNDWATREKASRELVGIGDPARKALRAALEDKDPEVRMRASNALISIGEEFSYAVECATSKSEHLREHGRAALMNLFKIDDPKVLRVLTRQEMQQRYMRWNRQFNVMAPPAIALARLQAVSGVTVLVGDDVRKDWARAMAQPTANIAVRGSPERISYTSNALQVWLNSVLGNLSAEDRLVPRPMRIGRTNFLYVARASANTNLSRKAGEQLVADLLKQGDDSVRAAALLAEGAASDAEAADNIREQYTRKPDLTRLMWLAVALGADEATLKCVRARDGSDALELLKSHDWKVMESAAKYFACLDPGPRGAALSPVIATSEDSLELLSAVWIARGSPLSDAARTRVGRLVSSDQDILAAAAARWLAGASDITDAELQQVWSAGENKPLDSSFYTTTLELVRRPDIGDRLVGMARKSFKGVFDAKRARHALAAAVLIGRATPDDLAIALDKLTGARGASRLVSQMAEMFKDCKQLSDDTVKKFESHLYDSDAGVRGVYLVALRKCAPELRRKIAAGAIEAQKKEDADVSLAKSAAFARLALKGILVGAGDSEALDAIIKAVEGDDAETAKAGGAAYVDAFEGKALFKALEELNNRPKVVNASLAALAGYMEICRRAARDKDRVTFRKAYGIAFNIPLLRHNWQLQQELVQMQTLMGNAGSTRKHATLPNDPVLKNLKVAVK